MVALAQLVEREIVILDVVGSIPTCHPSNYCEGSLVVELLAVNQKGESSNLSLHTKDM